MNNGVEMDAYTRIDNELSRLFLQISDPINSQ